MAGSFIQPTLVGSTSTRNVSAVQAPSGADVQTPSTSNSSGLTASMILDYVASKMKPPSLCADLGSKDAKVDQQKEVDSKSSSVRVLRTPSQGLKGGIRPLRITLPISFQTANTAASKDATVLSVDVTTSVEWSALSSLYDIYRLRGGRMRFTATNTSAALPAAASDTMLVVGWDPSDGTALTSTRNGCELAQHVLFVSPSNDTSGGVVVADGFSKFTCVPLDFSFKTEAVSEITISAAGAVSSTPGMWKQVPAAGSNAAVDGYLKFYVYNGLANSATSTWGILFLDVELRSRK